MDNFSYASYLTKEDIEECKKIFLNPVSQSLLDFEFSFPPDTHVEVHVLGEGTESKIPGARHVGELYEVKNGCPARKVAYMPNKTKIRKNRLFDESSGIEVKKVPAVLGGFVNEKGELKNALSEALTRWKGRNHEVVDGTYDGDEIWRGVFHKNFDPTKVRIATLDEAINGVEGARFFKALDFSKSTSLGFSEYGKSMNDLFPKVDPTNPNNHKRKASKELELILSIRWKYIEQGEFPPYLCLGTLKDELKKKGKQHKPRLFANGSKLNLIEARRIFGLFFEQVVSHEGDGDVYVGVNPHGFGWQKLFQKMAFKSLKKCIASDIEAWDFNLFIAKFAEEFEKECLRRRIDPHVVKLMMGILKTTMHPYFVIGSSIYHITGMPSGSFITAIMNSIFNSWSNRSCWVNYKDCLYEKYDRSPSDFDFDMVMAMATFGDDVLISVVDWLDAKDWNGVILARERKRLFQLNTTSISKDGGELEEFCDLDTTYTWNNNCAQFLQRQFRREGDGVVPILNIDSIEAMVQYVVPNGEIPLDRMELDRFDTAIRELAYYPADIYNEYKEKFLKMIRVRHPNYEFPTDRDTLLREYFRN
jgi:hypothetical protein